MEEGQKYYDSEGYSNVVSSQLPCKLTAVGMLEPRTMVGYSNVTLCAGAIVAKRRPLLETIGIRNYFEVDADEDEDKKQPTKKKQKLTKPAGRKTVSSANATTKHEIDPIPTVANAVASTKRPVAQTKPDGKTWPGMKAKFWPHPNHPSYKWAGHTTYGTQGRFLNDDGVEDENGLWQWNNGRETWYRQRKPLITVACPFEPLPVVSVGLSGRPSAKQKLDGNWYPMPKTLWPHPYDSSYNWTGQTSVVDGKGRFLNDDGVEDKNGLWHWNIEAWYRRRVIRNAQNNLYFLANRDDCLLRMRLYNRHRRVSRGTRWSRHDAAIEEILNQASVKEITMPGNEVFPDENEYLNVDRRDEVLPSLVRVFGGPNLQSDIDPSNKHSAAFESLLDAHDNDIPLVVSDSEYGTTKDVPRKDQTSEFALGWFGWDGQMLDYLSWKNEDGSYLSNEQWDEIHEVIRTKCIGMPICGWGSPELRIFTEAGRDDGIDAMQAILTRFPQLRNAKTKGVKKIDGLTRDITKRFSMAMDCLTSIFGMRSRAYHNAIDDIMGEAVVITAYVRFTAQFDDMYAEEKSEA